MEYFYCYDKPLMKYLRYDCDINFVCSGKHLTTDNIFWLFERTNELSLSIEKHNETLQKKDNVIFYRRQNV